MASRKEQKAALRAERERRAAEAAAADRRRRLIGYAIGGALAAAAVAAIVVAITASGGGGGGGSTANASKFFPKEQLPAPKQGLSFTAAAKAAGCKVITRPAEGHNHVTGPVKYKTNPPSSGDHYPVPVHDAAYTKAPPITQLVHALEHGRILLWFKPSAPAAVRGKLKALYDESPNLMVLTPNETGMPYQVAASAWTGNLQHGGGNVPEFGHVLGCNTMNDNVIQALRAFRDAFRGQGPEQIPEPE